MMNPQTEELACLYVLDRLDERERAALEARLPHDPELAALVGDLESALQRRVRALPQHEPPSGLLSRIEARIDRLPGAAAPAPASAVPLWSVVARWGIAAVIAAGIGTIAVQYARRSPQRPDKPFVIIVGLDSRQSTLAELPMKGRPDDADGRFIQLASLAEQYWDNPEDIPLKMGPAGKSGRGYALFDPGSNQGFIAIRQLPATEPGKRFHLWMLDTATGKVREAGALPSTESTGGLYFFSVEPVAGSKPGSVDFFVTAEDASAPSPDQPRGQVVLGDKRI
jgi:anti-sigma-K factor RskA